MELTGVNSVLINSQATNDRVVLSEPSIFPLATPNGTIYQTDRILTLYNAMGSDTGDYYCMASNGNTVQPTDHQNFSIFVQSMWSFSIIVSFVVLVLVDESRIFFTPGPPSILLPPEDAVIIDGNSVTFQCEVFAFPEHQTLWTFTDSEGVTMEIISNDTEKYSVERDREDHGEFGQLTVMNVQYEDRGTYSCTAQNPQGSRTANATLTVHGMLQVHDL